MSVSLFKVIVHLAAAEWNISRGVKCFCLVGAGVKILFFLQINVFFGNVNTGVSANEGAR